MFNFPYIRRELEAPILRGTLRNRAELILGPRQVGKSTMLDHLVQNQRFIKLTGEDEDDLSILADPKTFLTLRKLFKNPCSQAELNKIVPFGFSLQRQKMVFFCH